MRILFILVLFFIGLVFKYPLVGIPILVIIGIGFFILVSVENKKQKEANERKEAQEKQENEKREQERIAQHKRQEKLYKLVMQMGKEAGTNNLRNIVFGFEKRSTHLTTEQRELWNSARRALFEMGWQETELTFSNPPQIPTQIPEPFDYEAPWWKTYSAWYRDKRNGVCEECKLDLNYDRYYLHTHHMRGTQYNELKDLRAFCIACHAEQPGHAKLKTGHDYLKFIEKYGEQREKTLNSCNSLSTQFEDKVVQESFNQGYQNSQNGQYEEAIKDYDNAIRLKPDYIKAYNNRGVAKQNIGQYEEAIKDYDNAIRLKPDYELANKNLSVAKRKLDDKLPLLRG